MLFLGEIHFLVNFFSNTLWALNSLSLYLAFNFELNFNVEFARLQIAVMTIISPGTEKVLLTTSGIYYCFLEIHCQVNYYSSVVCLFSVQKTFRFLFFTFDILQCYHPVPWCFYLHCPRFYLHSLKSQFFLPSGKKFRHCLLNTASPSFSFLILNAFQIHPGPSHSTLVSFLLHTLAFGTTLQVTSLVLYSISLIFSSTVGNFLLNPPIATSFPCFFFNLYDFCVSFGERLIYPLPSQPHALFLCFERIQNLFGMFYCVQFFPFMFAHCPFGFLR